MRVPIPTVLIPLVSEAIIALNELVLAAYCLMIVFAAWSARFNGSQ
jgi:hypothetical protein